MFQDKFAGMFRCDNRKKEMNIHTWFRLKKIKVCVGNAPNITFPCATLYEESTGRIAIHYGGAGTVTALTIAKLEEVLDFVKATSDLY